MLVLYPAQRGLSPCTPVFSSHQKNNIIFICFPLLSSAQGSHYWSQGFGAQGTFLSGSMLATVNDNSALFYNPAGIARLVSSEVSINANVYGISAFHIADGVGDGKDLNSVRALLFPQLLSGSFKLSDSKFSIVLGYLSRHYAKNRIALFDTQIDDYLPTADGAEAYNINFDVEGFLHEQWGGMGIGYQVTDDLQVGVSTFITYRNQRSQELFSRTLINLDSAAFEPISINSTQRTVIDVVSLLLKFGVQYHKGPWHFGGTVTIPKLKLFSFGNGRFEESTINVSEFYPRRIDGLAYEQSTKYRTTYKSPLSVAGSVSYEAGKNTWHLAGEFFAPINNYTVAIPKEPFTVVSPVGKRIEYRTTLDKGSLLIAETSARAVFNVAIGLDRKIKENLTAHYGFRTDFNYFNGVNENNVEFDRDLWDLYHFTIGMSTKKDKLVASVGLDNAFGFRADLPRFGDTDLPNFNQGGLGFSDETSTAVTYVGMLVIGVTKLF